MVYFAKIKILVGGVCMVFQIISLIIFIAYLILQFYNKKKGK
uniref:Rifin n=1 Tax=Inoviridae sp. ctDDr4 TaxID=2825777 RepID=A0A8S5V656_9VIRU|nr:MAG TPA: Rifin [Inoviridae sp. ctDDr4]